MLMSVYTVVYRPLLFNKLACTLSSWLFRTTAVLCMRQGFKLFYGRIYIVYGCVF